MNSDFKELLSLFNENKVSYLIVGGYAVMLHSEPRYTKDLDLWIETSSENAQRVFKALSDFGAPLAGLSAADFAQEDCFYQMGRPPVRVDILMAIDGVRFEEAWRKRLEVNFFGVPSFVISREDLILNKRIAGRPQDLIDADALAGSQEEE